MAVNPRAKLPEVTAESDVEGSVNLVFRVQEYKPLADGSQSIRVAGLHKGREVGFELILDPTWKKGKLSNDLPIEMSKGTVSYRRVGPASDAFLQVLDELYGVKQNPKVMAADTRFTAISLQGDPGNLASGPVIIKLFYEAKGEDRYAELYTDIDIAACRLEVGEKDEGYRVHIVQALQGK